MIVMPLPSTDVARPSWLELMMEWRAPAEFWAGMASLAFLRRWPRGDGHPVLVFPGLIANDVSTLFLRRVLQQLGYISYGWGQGFNIGPRHGVIHGCLERIDEIQAEHDQPLTLLGWSLGGVYARECAKLRPHSVRQVITLGSPFRGSPEATNAYAIFKFFSRHRIDSHLQQRLGEAPPVPVTSIFSRSDAIVPWQLSVQAHGPHSESVEVTASHFGIGFNPAALYVVANRLAQPHDRWAHFKAEPSHQRHYPDPYRPD